MFSAIYQTLVALAAAAIFGLSVWVNHLRHRQQQDAADREAAQHDQIERAAQALEATRRKYNQAAPVDPSKRADFERP